MKVNLTIGIPEWLDRICAWPVMVYRKQKYGYSFRRIYLGENKFTIVDPQDFYRFNYFNWCIKGDKDRMYAVRFLNKTGKEMVIVSLHREIMNAPKGLLVDHRFGNTLDNRRANLRLATHAQNTYNNRKRKNTSSQYLGVSFEKRTQRWAAQIQYRGKTYWLGRFKSEIEAARAHDRAAIKYFGEFARLNFPRENYINEVLV